MWSKIPSSPDSPRSNRNLPRILLEPEELRKAVEDSVPPAFATLNLQAFDKGYEYGEKLLSHAAEREEPESVATMETEA